MPDVVVRTEGVYFWTASGKKVMDWTSGQMSCLIGHGHPEVVDTVRHHAQCLDHLYSGMISPPVIQLGQKLTANLPKGLDKAMFLSTGGESNECAIKLAKVVSGKFEIVGLGASWHGMTSGANGAQYHAGRKGYGPLVSRWSTGHESAFLTSVYDNRCPECICFHLPTHIAPSFGTTTAHTTGKQSSTTVGPLSTKLRAAPSPRL